MGNRILNRCRRFAANLSKGEQDDWFDSSFITTLAIASAIGMVLFIWRELFIRHPAVDLRVLRH